MSFTLRIVLAALAILGALYLLVFGRSEPSAVVESSVAPSAQLDSSLQFADGPLHASADLRAVGIYELPGQVENPSAIAYGTGKIYVSTHQGELFVLTPNYELLDQPSLPVGPVPMGQESFEGMTLTDYGLWGVGKQGVVGHWQLEDWRRLEEQPLTDPMQGLSFTGVAAHEEELLATFVTPPDTAIAVANLSRGTVEPLRFGPFVKQGRDASELNLSGIASDGINLFAITRNFPSIIVIDPTTMATIDVAQIDPIMASGISVYDKLVYATAAPVNSDQPASIYVYDLDEIIR